MALLDATLKIHQMMHDKFLTKWSILKIFYHNTLFFWRNSYLGKNQKLAPKWFGLHCILHHQATIASQ